MVMFQFVNQKAVYVKVSYKDGVGKHKMPVNEDLAMDCLILIKRYMNFGSGIFITT